MSIFAKKIPKEEIDAIYVNIKSIADSLMNLTDMYFGSLFSDEKEDDRSFRLLASEVHVLYAKYEDWLRNRVPTRTIIGRTADIQELLAEKHNYPYGLVNEIYNSTKTLIRKYQEINTAPDVEVSYANAYFDFIVGVALEDNGISFEEVGNDAINTYIVMLAGKFLKAREQQ